MTAAEGIAGFRGGLLQCFEDALSLARAEGRGPFLEGLVAELPDGSRVLLPVGTVLRAETEEDRAAAGALAEASKAIDEDRLEDARAKVDAAAKALGEACAALARSLRLAGPNLAAAMADYISDAIRERGKDDAS